ncbi:MAG: hypothetical protein IPJ17_18280 [Holophagales bacterium]|nr:MAG: hypothetical protein IPJ17_18280 [Holophagales bacterium]
MSDCRLLVARKDLLEVLRPMGRFLRLDTKQEAVLEPAPGGLGVALGGVGGEIPGEGRWRMRVRVPGGLFVGLARRLPRLDRIEISASSNGCRIGPITLPCELGPVVGGRVELPMDPSPGEVLALRGTHAPTVIDQSGLGPELEAVMERRDRLVMRALEILSPLGVTAADLLWAVERAVRRQAPRKPHAGQVARFQPPNNS